MKASDLKPTWVSLEGGAPFPYISVCQLKADDSNPGRMVNQYVAMTSGAAAVLAAELLALVPALKKLEEEEEEARRDALDA